MYTSFQAKYKVLDKIGEGSFSEVLKCQNRSTGIFYAAKRLKKTYQNVKEILKSPEVAAMRKITNHPNVLYMVESHYDPLPGKVTLIFELMEMSLYDLMKSRNGRLLMEIRVKNYIYQLLKGLHHLHTHGIFHRDIKPENILLKAGLVKIGDLGSIRGIYSRPPYTEYISTRWYRSPECLLTNGYYGPKMDIWASGCVFFELLALEPLFPGKNEVDQVSKIHSILGTPHARLIAKFRRISSRTRNGNFYFPARQGRGLASLLPEITDLGLEVLRLMLIYDPENRASTSNLLEHVYFADARATDTSRQSKSTSLPSTQWKESLILGYLSSSEKHCRKRLGNGCQSTLHRAESSETPRNTEARACQRNSTSFLDASREYPESTIPQLPRLEHLRDTQVGKYFLRKRPSHQNSRLHLQSKKWYDCNESSSLLKYVEKKHPQCEQNAKESLNVLPSNIYYQRFFLNKGSKSHEDHERNRLTGNCKLPHIYLQRNRNSNLARNDNSYKLKSTTTGECAIYSLPLRKTSTSTRSPKTKITKRESNDYYLRSTSFDSSKLATKKSYEKCRYHAN